MAPSIKNPRTHHSIRSSNKMVYRVHGTLSPRSRTKEAASTSTDAAGSRHAKEGESEREEGGQGGAGHSISESWVAQDE